MRILMSIVTIICLTFIALPCQATFTTYDTEAAFLAAAGSVDFQSFEALPPSDTGTDFLPIVSTPDFDVTTSEHFMQVWGNPPVAFAPDGDQVLFCDDPRNNHL